MQNIIKRLIKDWFPPALIRWIRKGRNISFSGDFLSWDEAVRCSSGYESQIILEQTKAALLKVKKVVPLKGECDLIFNDEGKPWGEEQVRKAFKSILKKAGLRELKFHSLRHSCASILLSKGGSVTYVAEQLRHSNPHITLTVYAHFVKTDKKSEVNLLDAPARDSGAPNEPVTLEIRG